MDTKNILIALQSLKKIQGNVITVSKFRPLKGEGVHENLIIKETHLTAHLLYQKEGLIMPLK